LSKYYKHRNTCVTIFYSLQTILIPQTQSSTFTFF